ncbi:hypothetical protein SAMN05421780_11115 [Flexibacter flexilis DSM 6793]|uniref:Uncharacterized protein n=1 Tax=Flexibacter flexilis DSM 6793 TaxID=927664 RepID=A0A1I1MNZ4_9BACT|nr:hypothetical protein [Flexibacter flexilis]SFC86875.1 hypothetical protein SAMN05421780_11115 [Flexibacter flexilis DSM 6793]
MAKVLLAIDIADALVLRNHINNILDSEESDSLQNILLDLQSGIDIYDIHTKTEFSEQMRILLENAGEIITTQTDQKP